MLANQQSTWRCQKWYLLSQRKSQGNRCISLKSERQNPTKWEGHRRYGSKQAPQGIEWL